MAVSAWRSRLRVVVDVELSETSVYFLLVARQVDGAWVVVGEEVCMQSLASTVL